MFVQSMGGDCGGCCGDEEVSVGARKNLLLYSDALAVSRRSDE